MRRVWWMCLSLTAIVTLVIGACVPTAARGTPRAEGDLLFVRTDSGLAAMDPATGRVAFSAPYAVALPDWSRLFTSAFDGQTTRLVALDGQSGAERAVASLPGDFAVSVVSGSGLLAALTELRPEGTSPWVATPRERTTLLVVDTTGKGEPRRYELAGNYEPEAFSYDDQWLFVIEYLPPTAPDRYRVRRLNLATGQVSAVGTRAKLPVEEEMRGTGRMQVLAPDRKTLYTLYTRQDEHLHAREKMHATSRAQVPRDTVAFVHVLNLHEGWAFCLDLPLPFGTGPASAQAIALSPDGRQLYVADRSQGLLAIADTERLQLHGTYRIDRDARADQRTVADAAADGMLYVASGSDVLVIDTAALKVKERWTVDGDISGLRVSPDSRRVYLGAGDRILVLDPASGEKLGALAALGIQDIQHVGRLSESSVASAR